MPTTTPLNLSLDHEEAKLTLWAVRQMRDRCEYRVERSTYVPSPGRVNLNAIRTRTLAEVERRLEGVLDEAQNAGVDISTPT
jgi:hypothetical protein